MPKMQMAAFFGKRLLSQLLHYLESHVWGQNEGPSYQKWCFYSLCNGNSVEERASQNLILLDEYNKCYCWYLFSCVQSFVDKH